MSANKKKRRRSKSTQNDSIPLRSLRVLRFQIMVVALSVSLTAQTPRQPPTVFRSGTELVLVNVVVRDKAGAVVRGLTRDDFTIAEDDKAQTVTSFDFEELDAPARSSQASPALAPQAPAILQPAAKTGVPPETSASASQTSAAKVDMHGRRLIVLFFDLSSMQPEAVQRAAKAAHDYVNQKLAPADLIGVASFSTSLSIDQDFTSDRELLSQAIDAYSGVGGQGFDAGATGDPEDTPDNGAAFTPDDTEFNIFNTDRRLDALQAPPASSPASNRRNQSSTSAAA
jgi:VWFA-related protein